MVLGWWADWFVLRVCYLDSSNSNLVPAVLQDFATFYCNCFRTFVVAGLCVFNCNLVLEHFFWALSLCVAHPVTPAGMVAKCSQCSSLIPMGDLFDSGFPWIPMDSQLKIPNQLQLVRFPTLNLPTIFFSTGQLRHPC